MERNKRNWFKCLCYGRQFLLLIVFAIEGSLYSSQSFAQGKDFRLLMQKDSSFLYLYQENSCKLLQNYGNNMAELQRMNVFIKLHLREIQSGNSHFLIISCIRPEELNNPKAINQASIRASVLRAYIKVMHRIAHSHVSFALDTLSGMNNNVCVNYIPRAISPQSSQISYTLNKDGGAVLKAVKEYQIIPLVATRAENARSSVSFLIKLDSTLRNSASYQLLYREKDSRILPRVYKSNSMELDRMDAFLSLHRQDILSGKNHLAITSFIRPTDLANRQIINAAAIQANVIRSYIKVKHSIDAPHFSFAFDSTYRAENFALVEYITQPVFSGFGKISYTLKRDNKSVLQAVKQYNPLPLAQNRDKWRKLSLMKMSELSGTTVFYISKDNKVLSSSLTSENPLPEINGVKITLPFKKIYRPFIGVKTNLLYWVGVTSEVEYRKCMPNLELEWYFAKRWSLNVDATYTYLEKNNTDCEIWGLSSIALEPRLWLMGNNKFNWIYVGAYGLTGDFDVKLNKLYTDGYTGDYNEAGLSLGCHIPFSSHWGMEVGGRYGYRMVNGDLYYSADAHYYRRSTFTQSGLKLTGIRLLLTYRFSKSIKKGGKR